MFLLYPHIGGQVLEKIALDYLNEEDEGEAENAIGEDDDVMTDSDDDLDVLEGPPLVFKTPRRKRARIARDQLDDSFLRSSRRLSKKFQGYKDAESAKKGKKLADAVEDPIEEELAKVEEPIPLAVIQPSGMTIAPHLPRDVLTSIGEGFLLI
jgi:hypothetical protein